MTNVICMSGGYDSTVLYDYLKKDEHLDLKVYHALYTKVKGGTYNLNEFKRLSQKFNNEIDYLAQQRHSICNGYYCKTLCWRAFRYLPGNY